ncbi:ABC transporter ATP-binding protein [Paenibacillus humicola]|uniref:ABC transporter ATP-binding protein n=1 Tax=Paenibacillus humicola TaxID=3110540 RepID=UPI00237BC47B|nr:ABC transporter ATP-binding protein [Paenibacillus humicola]
MKPIMHYFKQLQAFAGMKLYLSIASMVISSLLDSIGILLLIPMLSLSGILSGWQGQSFGFKWLNVLHGLPQAKAMPLILGCYLIIVLGQNLLQRFISIRNTEIQQRFSRRLRHDIYESLLKAKWSFFLSKRSSDLVNLLTAELARVVNGINLFMQFMTSFLFTLIQIALAFWISPGLTLFVLIGGGIMALFSRNFIRHAKRLGSQTSQFAQDYLAGISDQMNGIKDIKSNNLESSRMTWLYGLTEGMMHEQINYVRLRMNSQLVYRFASAVLIACFVFMSFLLFHTGGQSLLLIILIFARLWPRFTSLQSNMENIASTIPAFHALIELQRECLEAAEQGLQELNGPETAPLQVRHGLECRGLFFRYNASSPAYALQNINLYIPANQMTAIAGRSGAGKSTLIDLVMGLIQPESGTLLVDGTPVTQHNLLALRRSIGYVAQDPFLYNASIRENLIMIKPDATEDELWEALEFASSADFVRRMPQGLDTVIGDRGVRLSGGERQRLVLARAVIRKPAILVLDEATSSLDTENEKRIQEALDRLRGTMTVIVVAHRLSTIRHADQIIVIDNGHLVQRGTFSELASANGGVFRGLLSNQGEAV